MFVLGARCPQAINHFVSKGISGTHGIVYGLCNFRFIFQRSLRYPMVLRNNISAIASWLDLTSDRADFLPFIFSAAPYLFSEIALLIFMPDQSLWLVFVLAVVMVACAVYVDYAVYVAFCVTMGSFSKCPRPRPLAFKIHIAFSPNILVPLIFHSCLYESEGTVKRKWTDWQG